MKTILLRALILQGRIQVRVEDHAEEEFRTGRVGAYGIEQARKIRLRTGRQDLVVGVVVMDAVAEEHALGIDEEIVPFGRLAVAGIVLENVFQQVADLEVVFEILVPSDVAAGLGRFTQVVDVFLLLQGKIFPERHLVTQDFDVREFVDGVFEIRVAGFRPAGSEGEANSESDDHSFEKTHGE